MRVHPDDLVFGGLTFGRPRVPLSVDREADRLLLASIKENGFRGSIRCVYTLGVLIYNDGQRRVDACKQLGLLVNVDIVDDIGDIDWSETGVDQ